MKRTVYMLAVLMLAAAYCWAEDTCTDTGPCEKTASFEISVQLSTAIPPQELIPSSMTKTQTEAIENEIRQNNFNARQ